MMPVVRPRRKALLRLRGLGIGDWGSGISNSGSERARSSGASAIQPNAGCPNFGKLSARRMPDVDARRTLNERVDNAFSLRHRVELSTLAFRTATTDISAFEAIITAIA